jgi:hypothetical protein
MIPTLTLPDPDDGHVLASAIYARAGVIITNNLSDFPPTALGVHGITAAHPDRFAWLRNRIVPRGPFNRK